MHFRLVLLGGTAALAVWSCTAPVENSPTVQSLTPDAISMTEATYVTIAGTGFAPTFVSSVDDGITVVDQDFALVLRRAEGTTDISIGADYLDADHIGAQIPSGLATGRYSVFVQGPQGVSSPVLMDALLVSRLPAENLCDLEQCTGGTCEDGVCVIECGAECEGVVCPEGVACEINCRGGGCTTLVDCSAASSCTIECLGSNTCAGDIMCGLGACEIECSGNESCAGALDCGASCACDVTCNGSANCMAGTECPLGTTCESGVGCTSAGDSCNTCG